MTDINIITLIIWAGFAVPIILGAFERFSRDRVINALRSLMEGLEFLFSFVLAIYLTKRVFFDNDSGFFALVYSYIPENIRTFLYGQDIMIYVMAVPPLMLIIQTILRLITRPIYTFILEPLTNSLYRIHNSMGRLLRSVMGALSQVPRAAFMVFFLALLLTFVSYYFPSPHLSRLMNDSEAYQLVYRQAVSPALNSNIAKKIPVLLNDSFAKAMETIPADESGSVPAPLKKNNTRVVTYFNGVTLEQAIKSTPQIDETARKLVGTEKNSKKKAYLIYQWVSQNISYDYQKAAMISKDPTGISSGSIIAFNTRKGICFDYSSLYISMCRATGVKVRLITGLGYSGTAWGDHAWNQIYSSEEDRWINVDATFGSNGYYFDKRDFNVDHRYAEIQGEW